MLLNYPLTRKHALYWYVSLAGPNTWTKSSEKFAAFAGSEKRGFLCCAFFWISIRRAPFPSCGITSHDVNFSASSSRPYRSMSTSLDSFIQPLLGHVFLASTEESLCSVALVSTLPTHLTTSPETVSYLSVSGVLAGYFFTKVRVLEFLEPL